jgi:hypothetical protein
MATCFVFFRPVDAHPADSCEVAGTSTLSESKLVSSKVVPAARQYT